MATLPASGYLSDVRTNAEQQTAFEALRDFVSQIPASAEVQLTISSGTVTPATRDQGSIKVETEAAAASDDLANIAQTNVGEGSLLLLRAHDAAHTVVVKHAAGGAGQIYLQYNADFSLTDTDMWLLLKRVGSNWEEVFRSYGNDTAAARAALGVTATDVWGLNEFRLTLTSGLPVTTADVTAATTIYACPTTGKRIALYDGAAWNIRASAEFSLALGTLTSGKPYDVFCYDNAGTPTLEALAWTNDTTRATALAYQDGVLVKTGDATRRYLGTFYTTSTTTTEDSIAKRYLWNYYHRALKPMRVIETTNTWTYSTATWRQARATASNQLDMVIGVDEDAVSAIAVGTSANSTAGVSMQTGIGLDSTSVPTGLVGNVTNGSGNHVVSGVAHFNAHVGAGRHYLAWLERSGAAATTTWHGDNGSDTSQSGIQGSLQC